MFSPSALPADATHCDDGRVRDVDVGQGEALLKEHHHATWVLTGTSLTLYSRALCQERS